MFDLNMQDILTIAAGEARAEAYLEVIKAMLREYYPDIKLMRQILCVAAPESPYMKKEATTDAE